MDDNTTPTWGQDSNENLTPPSSGEAEGVQETGQTEAAKSEEETGASEKGGASSERSAQGRIEALIAETKRLNEKLATYESRVPIPSVEPEKSQDVLKAIDQLKKLGFVDQDYLDKKFGEIEDKMILNTEHNRLEETYSGSDGRPKYNRQEVEDYMRTRGIFQPEVAYKALHEPELIDWHLKQATQKKRPYMAPPSLPSTGGDQTITRERIAEMQKSPNWREWYEKNRTKILSLMAQGQL